KNYLYIGLIGIIRATIILGKKVFPEKKSFANLPCAILITIGAITGLGTGLDASGGGELIANSVISLFGGKNASVAVLTVVIIVLTVVLTNIMQNNATAAMMTPIAISIALSIGISP